MKYYDVRTTVQGKPLLSTVCLYVMFGAKWAIPENIHTYTTDGFSDFQERGWGG